MWSDILGRIPVIRPQKAADGRLAQTVRNSAENVVDLRIMRNYQRIVHNSLSAKKRK